MSIQEFLLARVVQDESENDALTARNPTFEHGSMRQHRYAALEHRRSVIYRHHERSVTVTGLGTFETVTRCEVCTGETSRPCGALRTLAQPYSRHPDYDKAWDPSLACNW